MKSRPTPKPLFLERIQKLLPDKKDYQAYLEILKHEPVRSIRCNTLKISPQELKKKLETKDWKINQPWENHLEVMIVEGKLSTHSRSQIDIGVNNKKLSKKNLSLENSQRSALTKSGTEPSISSASARDKLIDLEPGELGRALEHLLGYYYIQELASMLPIIALKPKQNEIILDLCSAPGSKTTQMASEMKNTGTIIANEVSLGRIKILASNLERCGVTNTIITKKEGVALCKKLKNQNLKFDKILIDAPCSGEGTLRSSPKTYLMWNIKTVKNLSKTQKKLIVSAIEILKIGGELIYSTCTHAPEENEGVVDFILKNFPNMKIEKITLPVKCRKGLTRWVGGDFNPEIEKSCRIYPQDNNTEGFFITKFKKIK